MSRTIFEWREDEEFGGYGWIPKGKPHFNANEGLGIAHDTLEHFPADANVETMDAEMRAFGAMLYMRVESGWYYQNAYRGAADVHLGSDIGRFLQEVRFDQWKLTNPGITRRIDETMEDEMDAIFKTAIKNANEWRDDDPHFKLDHTTDWMRGWMRRGYRACIKRYHGAKPHELAYLFDQVKETVDKQYERGDEGQELHVLVNHKTLELKLRRVEPEYFY